MTILGETMIKAGERIHEGSCGVGFATVWGKVSAAQHSRHRRHLFT